MKLFQLTQIILVKRVTIIARDDAHAADMVVGALARAFGQTPDVLYDIGQRRPTASPEKDLLQRIVEAGEPGFVQENEHFWDIFDPFEDW